MHIDINETLFLEGATQGEHGWGKPSHYHGLPDALLIHMFVKHPELYQVTMTHNARYSSKNMPLYCTRHIPV